MSPRTSALVVRRVYQCGTNLNNEDFHLQAQAERRPWVHATPYLQQHDCGSASRLYDVATRMQRAHNTPPRGMTLHAPELVPRYVNSVPHTAS